MLADDHSRRAASEASCRERNDICEQCREQRYGALTLDITDKSRHTAQDAGGLQIHHPDRVRNLAHIRAFRSRQYEVHRMAPFGHAVGKIKYDTFRAAFIQAGQKESQSVFRYAHVGFVRRRCSDFTSPGQRLRGDASRSARESPYSYQTARSEHPYCRQPAWTWCAHTQCGSDPETQRPYRSLHS